MERFKSVLVVLVISGGFFFILYLDSIKGAKERAERITIVEDNYRYSKGVITRKHSYKGHSIRVKYKIEGKEYEFRGGWDVNPNDLSEGDSISFKYSVENPNMIITEMENDYY